MKFVDIIKDNLSLQFTGTISVGQIMLALVVSFLISLFIVYVYRKTYVGVVYSKSFSLCLILLSMITSIIICTINSNLALSLGMVGALSIVRFRTAIKEPKDLLFLFWAISNGIIIGAGLYSIAFILAIVLSISLLLFEVLPFGKSSMLLVINMNSIDIEKFVESTLKKNASKYSVKSRNVFKDRVDIIYEINTKNEKDLLIDLSKKKEIISINLIKQD